MARIMWKNTWSKASDVMANCGWNGSCFQGNILYSHGIMLQGKVMGKELLLYIVHGSIG